MNKKVVLAVVVIVLLLGGGYASYRVYKHFKRLATPTVQTSENTNTTSPISSLKDLLSKGVAESCTFKNDSSNGTVYVSGGKVRGDFDTSLEGKNTKSHMIVADNTSYIWTDGQTEGFKMSFDPNQTPKTETTAKTANSVGSFDPTANNDYKCSTWVVDGSLFDLPKGVNFSSFAIPTTSTESSPATGAQGSSSQCSYCDALSGSDKTQCLTALKCN